MRLFHRTAQGASIVRDGFRDAEGSYGLEDFVLRGVFLSDVPLDMHEGLSTWSTGNSSKKGTLPGVVSGSTRSGSKRRTLSTKAS
jgi:hypothetical protein